MSIDVMALIAECERWGVRPDSFSTLNMAHALLAKLPTGFEFGADPDADVYALQWLEADIWQAEVSGSPIETGAFETCVTAIAAKASP